MTSVARLTIACEECGYRMRTARVFAVPLDPAFVLHIICHGCEAPLVVRLSNPKRVAV